MADWFGTSKGNYHASIKRMSSILVSVMPEVVKLPSNQQECNATSDQFSEKSHWLQNVIGAIDGCHIQIKASNISRMHISIEKNSTLLYF
jgi:hypothetical protein